MAGLDMIRSFLWLSTALAPLASRTILWQPHVMYLPSTVLSIIKHICSSLLAPHVASTAAVSYKRMASNVLCCAPR